MVRSFVASSFLSFFLFLLLFAPLLLLLLGRRDVIGSTDFCFPKRHASLMGITKKKFKKKRWKRDDAHFFFSTIEY
jgi:hypothetical protein